MATKTKDKQQEGEVSQEESQLDSQPDPQADLQSEETQGGQASEIEEGAGLEFQHPMLKGKTPEEIERFVEFQDQMVRNQQQQLRNRQNTPAAPQQQQKESQPDLDVTDDDFYNKPVDTMRKLMQKMLKQEVEPFRRDLQQTQAGAVRERLRSEFSDFSSMEPYIDQMISANNFPNPNDEGLLRTLYFTAKGMIASGSGPQQQQAPQQHQPQQTQQPSQPSGGRQSRQAPPQHRPSASPLPSQDAPSREVSLTEEEKRMAREWRMTPQEFAQLRDADVQGFMEGDDE